MKEKHVTMTELRQNLGSLINQAAFGQELVVLISHGKPKAAIVNVDALDHLRQWRGQHEGGSSHLAVLTRAADLRARNRQWQITNAVQPEDSTETLRRLREEPERTDH